MSKDISKDIKIDYVDIDLLKPYPGNPNVCTEETLFQLEKSIREQGVLAPITINMATGREYFVLGGNQRLNILKKIGIKKVPVFRVCIKNIKDEKKANLRLNKVHGEPDPNLIKDFVDLETLLECGFDANDLNVIYDEQLETENDDFDEEEERKKITETKIKEGDIFQLGRHRIGCLDSTKPESTQKLLGDKKVSMLYCDSPYNINLSYNSGIGAKNKYGGTKTDDSKTDDEYRNFLLKTIENGLSVGKKDMHVFYWCDHYYIGMIQELYKALGVKPARVCTWIKNSINPTPQIAFSKACEFCVYGTLKKPYLSKMKQNLSEILNKEIGTGNRAIDDILDLLEIWLVKRLPTNSYEHPTQKPITLHEKPIKRCTAPGDIILDLFCGSGSTLLACEQLNRVCYTADLDPIFVQLTINRYEKATGIKAKKIN